MNAKQRDRITRQYITGILMVFRTKQNKIYTWGEITVNILKLFSLMAIGYALGGWLMS